VSGGIYQVEYVLAAIDSGIGDSHRLALDGDAPFPLYVHVVQDLILKIAVCYKMAFLDEAVGKGRLSVIDMRNDAEIAYVLYFSHA
jgi:hypothetical protein